MSQGIRPGAPEVTRPRVPRHTRERPAFAETFSRSINDTLSAMDRAGDDVPLQIPAHRHAIEQIGIERHAMPVSIDDPFDGSASVMVPCRVKLAVSLASDRRGIHVSRLGDVLAEGAQQSFRSLWHYADALAERIRRGQEAERAQVEVEGTLSYLEDVTGRKAKASVEHLSLGARVRRTATARTATDTWLGFNIITACPCVQQTFKHSQADAADDPLLASIADAPLMTHSQRCRVRLTLSGVDVVPDLTDLLTCIDRVVVRSQNTLPREFELLSVHRAHVRPQFLEDVLRDLLQAATALVGPASPSACIEIEAHSMESIHDFDISGTIRGTAIATPSGEATRPLA